MGIRIMGVINMKAKIMFVVSVLFLVAMSSLASASWRSSNVWDQWDDGRVIKEEHQYSSIANWRESTQAKATEKMAYIEMSKKNVLVSPNVKMVYDDTAKFDKSTTIASSTGVTKIARIQSISFVKKQNGIINMRGDVLVGNTHQRIHFDQNVAAGTDLRNLKVYDFVTIAFKQKDNIVGGRGMKTYIELVERVDVRAT